MKKKIFIDTDMFTDDIITLMLFLLSKNYEIIGISTVNGVSSLRAGTNNLLRILTYLSLHIPVFTGASKPMKERSETIGKWWTNRGNKLPSLQNIPLPEKPTETAQPFTKFYRYIKQFQGNCTLICLGPLTNMATIMQSCEDFGDIFTNIIIMGGAISTRADLPEGRYAEYNMRADPEAAAIVFNSSLPITLVPLDATQYVPALEKQAQKQGILKEFQQFIQATLDNNMLENNNYIPEQLIIKELLVNNTGEFDCFYDPLIACILENPNSILKKITTGISIVLKGKERGKTLLNAEKDNVNVIMKVDAKKFYEFILNVLK